MHLLATSIPDGLLSMGVPVAEKVLRTIGVYLGLLAILRVAGKRDLAQLNSFDLVVLLLLSNVVQNAVIGPDNSLTGGLLGAVVLVAVNSVVVRLSHRSQRFSRIVEGTESVLVVDGTPDEAVMRSLPLREAELLAAVHRQGASTLAEVQRATIAPDGTITVQFRPEDENATKGDLDRIEHKLDALAQAFGGAAGGS